ncbi:eCIS core domain-containing protein [Calidithermus roseus]|uniref:DUF4157 domain-containing protein n=1 Tax=Calidithermus roseus TaxID=1644118 RepID=A0A399F1I9_9DEIN|nr:DUF4157 domain-containing protein [Calidithermus roseus]RIH88682.1 hypothetical protein Mrose_00715 [Calidithermus roseus]
MPVYDDRSKEPVYPYRPRPSSTGHEAESTLPPAPHRRAEAKAPATPHRARLEREWLHLEVQRYRRQLGEALEPPEDLAVRLQQRRGRGTPLPGPLHQRLEAHLGHPLPKILIHADDEAHRLSEALGAQAFTTGHDIFFRQGAYDPHSLEGQKLLAHEAAHVLQQSRGLVKPGLDPDETLELQAQRVEQGFVPRPAYTLRLLPGLEVRIPAQERPWLDEGSALALRGAYRRIPQRLAAAYRQGLSAAEVAHALHKAEAATQMPLLQAVLSFLGRAEGLKASLLRAYQEQGREHHQQAGVAGVEAQAQPASAPPVPAAVQLQPVLQRKEKAGQGEVISDLVAAVRQALAHQRGFRITKLLSPLSHEQLRAVAEEYERGEGRPLLNELYKLEWAGLSPQLLNRLGLAALGSQQEVTLAAFAEQLAISLAYANQFDLSDAKGYPQPSGSQGNANPARLLATFGYRALPAIQGEWGFQMRVFLPLPGRARFPFAFVAMRGTEGVNLPFMKAADLKTMSAAQFTKELESDLDTLTDFASEHTGYSQYEANRDVIAKVIQEARQASPGPMAICGHSLGGALAQIAAADHPQHFRHVFTFQSPGIRKADVEKLRRANPRLQALHLRVSNDVVPMAGQQLVDGRVHTYRRGKALQALDPTKTHNLPTLAEALQSLGPQHLTPEQQAIVRLGSQDPDEPSAAQDGVTPVAVSVHPSQKDPILRGEAAKQKLLPLVSTASFRAAYAYSVGYNALVEWVQPKLRSLTPEAVTAKGGVAYLVDRLEGILKQANALEQIPNTPQCLRHFTLAFGTTPEAVRREIGTLEAILGGRLPERGPFNPHHVPKALIPYRVAALRDLERKYLGGFLHLDKEVLNSNRAKLRFHIADLWYAQHPRADEATVRLWQAAQKGTRAAQEPPG